MTTHRRRFLRLCGAAGIGAVAGCSDSSQNDTTPARGTENDIPGGMTEDNTQTETEPTASVTEKWTYQTGDSIFSSPAVVDGTVYVGSANGTVYALSAADGTEQWAYETGAPVYSSPKVVDGTVYVGSEDNNVYALSA